MKKVPMVMNVFQVAALAVALSTLSAREEVRSPSGITRASIGVQPDGRLGFAVTFHDHPVVLPSPLGITLDGVDLGKNVECKERQRDTVREVYPMLGSKAQATNSYCAASFQVSQNEGKAGFQLEVRCFDEGFAWRYRVPTVGWHRIGGEASSWTLPAGSRIWFGERNNDWKLKSYAGEWMSAPVEEMPGVSRQGPVQGAPLVAELPSGTYVALSEAASFNYSGMRLRAVGDNRFQADFTEGSRGFEIEGEILTPWRVVILATDLDGLVNQTLVENLAPPPDPQLFADTSWIRPPGWSVWRWHLQGVGQPSDQKDFVNAAVALGYPYTLVDDGWEVCWKDPLADLKQLCTYAAQRKIGVFVWKKWAELRDPQDNYAHLRLWLDDIQKAGVAGAKVDFFNSEDLPTRRGEETLLRESARRHLMVDIHGCPKPTGETRTYPNLLSREGVRGLELNFMSEGPLPPRHDAALPFTRYIVGPGDYTPVTFQPGHLGKTTIAHQVAMAVVTTAPFQVLNEIPSNVLNHPVKEVAQVIKSMPTAWDETRVLPGSRIGELAIMARRKGDIWYVGAVNGDSARSCPLPLSFLSASSYEATILRDGQDSPLSVVGGSEKVTAATTLNLRLLSGGGFVALFKVLQESPAK